MELFAAVQTRSSAARLAEPGPNPEHLSMLLEAAARAPGKVVRNDGDAAAAMARAARRVQAEYYIPHMTQAPMEPPAATARIVDGRCEVWACVQAPQATL